MLGFIVTGLKLVGKIIVKAVKAAVVGAVVGCVSSNWKDLSDTSNDILDRTLDEANKKKEEICKEDKLTWKEKIVVLALIIKWITATTYAIILAAMSCVALIIDSILKAISKSIFKSTKEEEKLCSE